MKMRCFDCAYRQGSAVDRSSAGFGEVECHRFPPTSDGFPKVDPSQWCGEFKFARGSDGTSTVPVPD